MSTRDRYESLIASYVSAVGRGDFDAVANLFSEDAFLLEPGLPAIIGRQAIRELYREWLDGGVSVTVNIQDVQDRGDTVYGTGTLEGANGTGKWLQVLQHQGDGTLLIHRLCWNPN